jgi:hypothetical protein
VVNLNLLGMLVVPYACVSGSKHGLAMRAHIAGLKIGPLSVVGGESVCASHGAIAGAQAADDTKGTCVPPPHVSLDVNGPIFVLTLTAAQQAAHVSGKVELFGVSLAVCVEFSGAEMSFGAALKIADFQAEMHVVTSFGAAAARVRGKLLNVGLGSLVTVAKQLFLDFVGVIDGAFSLAADLVVFAKKAMKALKKQIEDAKLKAKQTFEKIQNKLKNLQQAQCPSSDGVFSVFKDAVCNVVDYVGDVVLSGAKVLTAAAEFVVDEVLFVAGATVDHAILIADSTSALVEALNLKEGLLVLRELLVDGVSLVADRLKDAARRDFFHRKRRVRCGRERVGGRRRTVSHPRPRARYVF